MNWESGVDVYTLPCIKLGFSGGLVGKILSAIQETWVQSQGWDDLLEEEMATHSSILAWKIPWTEELGRLQTNGVTKSWTRLSN